MNILDMMSANSGMNPVEVYIIRGSSNGSGLKNGRFIKGDSVKEPKNVTLQAATPKEIQFASGGQRISDVRKIYINDGTEMHPGNGDKVEINGELWSVISADNRPWHNYCKAIIVKEDTRKG